MHLSSEKGWCTDQRDPVPNLKLLPLNSKRICYINGMARNIYISDNIFTNEENSSSNIINSNKNAFLKAVYFYDLDPGKKCYISLLGLP